MNLITNLVALTHGDEVPLTATLGWFLSESPVLRIAILSGWTKQAPAISRLVEGFSGWGEPGITLETLRTTRQPSLNPALLPSAQTAS